MKHGKRYTKEYEAWQHMKSRCLNPKNKAYHNYGGRGITICDRWLKFENFIADMGNAPTPKHSLDRYPNNDGHYEPGNCRWATPEQQNLNKRRIINSIAKKAIKAGLNPGTVRHRVRTGWPLNLALTTPLLDKTKNLKSYKDQSGNKSQE